MGHFNWMNWFILSTIDTKLNSANQQRGRQNEVKWGHKTSVAQNLLSADKPLKVIVHARWFKRIVFLDEFASWYQCYSK